MKSLSNFMALGFVAVITACALPTKSQSPKLTFDLGALDANGLAGTPEGKVAISYEFCIPKSEVCEAEVRAIDPSVQFARGSRGRIGCDPDQTLCIGSTHQPGSRRILERLAALRYVERIDRCFFE